MLRLSGSPVSEGNRQTFASNRLREGWPCPLSRRRGQKERRRRDRGSSAARFGTASSIALLLNEDNPNWAATALHRSHGAVSTKVTSEPSQIHTAARLVSSRKRWPQPIAMPDPAGEDTRRMSMRKRRHITDSRADTGCDPVHYPLDWAAADEPK